jgi:transcriptional regulator with PAS, ATPase and Fis domain
LGLQSKLLRFLQDREIRRVGDTSMIKVDVRVLAATNEALQVRLREKAFREDLYYRISVIPIELPPLRERVEDIPLLVAHFMDSVARRLGRPRPVVPDEVLEVLKGYAWPGNVCELQNAVERASALCDDGVIALRDLPERILEAIHQAPTPPVAANPIVPVPGLALDSSLPLKEFVHQQEVRYIEHAIKAAGGNKETAAEKLGISIATLYRKLAVETEPAVNVA